MEKKTIITIVGIVATTIGILNSGIVSGFIDDVFSEKAECYIDVDAPSNWKGHVTIRVSNFPDRISCDAENVKIYVKLLEGIICIREKEKYIGILPVDQTDEWTFEFEHIFFRSNYDYSIQVIVKGVNIYQKKTVDVEW